MSLVIYINKLLAAPQSRHAISQPFFCLSCFEACHIIYAT